MSRFVRVVPYGAYANHAFQYMLAKVIKAYVPDAAIVGVHLPHWNVDLRQNERPVVSFSMEVRSHVFPLQNVIQTLAATTDAEVVLRCLSTRLAYYQAHRELFFSDFIAEGMENEMGYGPDHLVISIRLKDIIQTNHPYYAPLPISWYEELIATTGLQPVFYGQLGDDVYSRALRRRFPAAEFVESRGVALDFHTLQNSTNVVLSVSTFAWLAAWISQKATNIFLPVYMMFNPAGRPDVDMLPIEDSRYHFYQFPQTIWGTTESEIMDLLGRPHEAFKVDARFLRERYPSTGTDGTSLTTKPSVLVPSKD